MGYSQGHWEGDTLVIQTSRISWPYFDNIGSIPQSADAEITERFSLSDDGDRLFYEMTVADPATFTEPVSASWVLGWRPDMVVEEFDCIAEQ